MYNMLASLCFAFLVSYCTCTFLFSGWVLVTDLWLSQRFPRVFPDSKIWSLQLVEFVFLFLSQWFSGGAPEAAESRGFQQLPLPRSLLLSPDVARGSRWSFYSISLTNFNNKTISVDFLFMFFYVILSFLHLVRGAYDGIVTELNSYWRCVL